MKNRLIKSDIRYEAFQKALRFANYELVPGDVFEFGLYTGRSLALLQIAHEAYMKNSIHAVPFGRNFIGFDSFKGMVEANHPRWKNGTFATNHSWHPTIKKGEIVTGEKVMKFFTKLGLKPPTIVEGSFEKSVSGFFKKHTGKSAIVHIDCDTYENTSLILKHIKGTLQEGTVLLFDDWFNYKGSPRFGEARAFNEFQKNCKQFSFIDYFNYGTFCKAFISVPR